MALAAEVPALLCACRAILAILARYKQHLNVVHLELPTSFNYTYKYWLSCLLPCFSWRHFLPWLVSLPACHLISYHLSDPQTQYHQIKMAYSFKKLRSLIFALFQIHALMFFNSYKFRKKLGRKGRLQHTPTPNPITISQTVNIFHWCKIHTF